MSELLLQVDSDVAHRESVVLFMSELLLQVDSDVAHRESVVVFMSECCCRSTVTWPIESQWCCL